jgi:hypothetical protein
MVTFVHLDENGTRHDVLGSAPRGGGNTYSLIVLMYMSLQVLPEAWMMSMRVMEAVVAMRANVFFASTLS